MSAETATDSRFEIGHVLFIDVVGYGKLNIDEQTRLLRDLNKIVRATRQFRHSEADGKLICLPTGDGMALVFRDSAESPAQCALEASMALQDHGRLPVRMGIHSGPVNEVNDVNNRINIAGAGINIAQRVMDCGDAGHILLSKHVSEDLEHYSRWRPLLHELDDLEVKHAVRIGVVNLYSDSVGNPQIPDKIKRAKVESKRVRNRILIAAALILAASSGFFAISRSRTSQPSAPIPLKSIAVLPFASLSADPENAYFSEGMQDEILTDLARIADLKVISHTSVAQYTPGTARNVRAIAQALGVAHLLEGSVQRANGKVRINAQLIDARNDAHIWARSYDRDLTDVFAIQSEIAETIAKQLRLELSATEKAAIEKPPTTDLFAYDLYTRAGGLVGDLTDPGLAKEKLPRAISLLKEAVTRDAHFVTAWCLLSKLEARMYSAGFDHTPQRLEQSRHALEEAFRYEPEAGEVHLALANFYYQSLDYQRARAELAIAQSKLPNSAQAYELTGYILRRKGEWEEATRNLERAVALDPRKVHTLQQLALTYQPQRRYDDQARIYQRVLTITPGDRITRLYLAIIQVDARADLRPFQAFLKEVSAETGDAGDVPDDINYDLCERTSEGYARGLANFPREGSVNAGVNYPHSYWEGVVALCQGERDKAHLAFSAARAEVASTLDRTSELPGAISLLGLIDAGLGRKEDAIREGLRACELLSVSKDALDGAVLAANLVQIYTWTGEKEQAIAHLEALERVPNYLSYGLLKLQPIWDPLRGDPRFEKLVASLAPKD